MRTVTVALEADEIRLLLAALDAVQIIGVKNMRRIVTVVDKLAPALNDAMTEMTTNISALSGASRVAQAKSADGHEPAVSAQ